MPPTNSYNAHKPPSPGGERIGGPSEWIHQCVGRVEAFWQRVTEGLELQELWRRFKAEAHASYALYSKEVDWESFKKESRARRLLKIGRALFWAMILKLSPARRVFLLLGLALLALALAGGWSSRGSSGPAILLSAGSLLLLLALELADRVTMKRDLEIAREIQHWLVPEVPPEAPGVDIAFATRPANTVAGDYYDAFLRTADTGTSTPGRLLLAVADVAGKGVPAALLMATFQASLHTLAGAPTSLLDLVAGLNRYACAHSLGGQRFTTAFLAELDPVTRTLSYINAGHNAPVLRRVSGGIERLEAGGLPLGIRSQTRYDSGTTTLDRGDLLVIFTDGLVEAESESGAEYGDLRLFDVLKEIPDGSASQQLQRLMDSVDSFVGHARQHDDITCLILLVESG
ncbi:MAG TPA: PP2C family protein-serine/threonine phosphatase [Acidobacteriota bacterium]|jgi:serine phosphatase RsbU (regulator of sigma subunit)